MCDTCGRPLPAAVLAQPAPHFCRLCRARFFGFARARSDANYNEVLGKTIMLLKFEEVKPLRGWLAERLSGVVRSTGETFRANELVQVPLHPVRIRERGYKPGQGDRAAARQVFGGAPGTILAGTVEAAAREAEAFKD